MRKVLITNDLMPYFEAEGHILKRSDIKLFIANSGLEVLNLHKQERMHLIAVSLESDVFPGDELCRKIREDPELKKVSLIVVCHRRKSDIKRCAESGANSYLTYPVEPDALKKEVEKLIDVPYRKNLRVLIRVSVKSSLRSESFFCVSENISRTGLLIESEKTLARRDHIDCSFFLPEEEHKINAVCEVVRIEKKKEHSYHYGVRFIKIEPDAISAIDRYVKMRADLSM